MPASLVACAVGACAQEGQGDGLRLPRDVCASSQDRRAQFEPTLCAAHAIAQ